MSRPGTTDHLTNVSSPMVLNPDPRPGRWLLPLVILGMMVFTYVFVQNLPAADGETQDIGANGVDAQTTTTTAVSATTSTTAPAPVLSPEVQDYLNQVATAETDLLAFQAEMADINGRWDAEPRTLEYADGEALLTDLPRRAAELLPAGAKADAERRAADLLLGPLSELAREREREYAARATREARFARLCDKLHLGVRLVGYLRAGARGLGGFRSGLAELDCREFAPCDELRREILEELGPASEDGG